MNLVCASYCIKAYFFVNFFLFLSTVDIQMLCDFTYMWNLKKKKRPSRKTEIDSQTQRKSPELPEGRQFLIASLLLWRYGASCLGPLYRAAEQRTSQLPSTMGSSATGAEVIQPPLFSCCCFWYVGQRLQEAGTIGYLSFTVHIVVNSPNPKSLSVLLSGKLV